MNRGRLHSRGAGDGHRPGRQIHFFDAGVPNDFAAALDRLAKNVVRVVIQEINLCARVHALPRRADDEGRLAAFGDGENHVARADAEIAKLLAPECGKILETLDGFDERIITARHDTESAILKIVRSGKPARALLLPEVTPDGIQQNAQSPGGAAAGKEDPSAVFQRAHQGFLDFPCPAGFDEFTEFANNIAIHIQKQFESGGGVLPGHFTQMARDRV